jgi:hypothetical protein
MNCGNHSIADRQIALPVGVLGITGCECLGDFQAIHIGLECTVVVSAGRADVAHLDVAGAQSELPVGVLGIAGCECHGDLPAIRIGLQGAVAVAASGVDVTY